MGINISGSDAVGFSVRQQSMEGSQSVQHVGGSAEGTTRGSNSMQVGSVVATVDKKFMDAGLDSQGLNKLNQTLKDAQYSIQFDTADRSGHFWLNVVDKSSGKVIYEIPAENVRKWVENYNSGNVSGLAFNVQR